MKKGICPKCQSREVYSGGKAAKSTGFQNSNTIPITGFRAASLDNYVCGQCGYVESYIAKEKNLALIKKKWKMVM